MLDANNRIFFFFFCVCWGGNKGVGGGGLSSTPTRPLELILLCFQDKKLYQSNMFKEILRKKTKKYMKTLKD